jgi:hypothetical protein
MDTDTIDCTIYDCFNDNADANTTNYLFNPVFTFFLIFSAVTLFYHCTTKSDLSLFEEFIRISREHNFHKLLVSSSDAVGEIIVNLTDNATTNNVLDIVNDPVIATDPPVATTDAAMPATNEPKFEDKFLDRYLALKLQSASELTTEFIESLMNCFVMEYTPNGNIIMFYDYKRETFSYYADNVMPYRFLEVLGRKYVCTFLCPSLYKYSSPDLVATCDTINAVENEKKEETVVPVKPEIETKKLDKPDKPEKSVFAKFKSYNKDTSNKVVTKDAPSSAPKHATVANAVNAPTVAETNVVTNRYTCHGKIGNMPFLKKIDRAVVDKNYKMSFADFKRLKNAS